MMELRPHQELALRKLRNGKVLWGGVGSGKSLVAATYYDRNEAPKDVYVITTAKKRDDGDWQQLFYSLDIGPRSGPSGPPLRGKGGHDGGTYPWVLTVDSWNNIAKYADVAGAFFIFDEQRLVGAGNWVRKFLRIAKRNNWILLSATPGDTWMDYIPLFVANNFYKNRSEFKREHVVYNTFTKFPKVDRYVNVGRLMKYRSQLLVEMPYERHTRRRHVMVPLEYDRELLEMVLKKRWHVYEDRPLRDVAELCSVSRKIVNSDPSRLEMVKELWTTHPKLIIFYNFNYELEILRSLSADCLSSRENKLGSSASTKSALRDSTCSRQRKTSNCSSAQTSETNHHTPSLWLPDGQATNSTDSYSIAEWNGHRHQPIPMTERWLYLVQYTAGAEGWDCVDTDAMVLYSRNYSWKVTEQSYGRIDRLNSPFTDLWYYNFTSESWIDRAIERSMKAKETFNEAKYVRLFAG